MFLFHVNCYGLHADNSLYFKEKQVAFVHFFACVLLWFHAATFTSVLQKSKPLRCFYFHEYSYVLYCWLLDVLNFFQTCLSSCASGMCVGHRQKIKSKILCPFAKAKINSSYQRFCQRQYMAKILVSLL